MLYYYFDSKDGLFRAVLEAAYEHIRESEKALHLDAVDPPEAIRSAGRRSPGTTTSRTRSS